MKDSMKFFAYIIGLLFYRLAIDWALTVPTLYLAVLLLNMGGVEITFDIWIATAIWLVFTLIKGLFSSGDNRGQIDVHI